MTPEEQIAQLRASNRKLHRRCQAAESAVASRIESVPIEAMPRNLLVFAAAKVVRELKAAEEEIKRLKQQNHEATSSNVIEAMTVPTANVFYVRRLELENAKLREELVKARTP